MMDIKTTKPSCIALFSGGLDSIICVKWMQKAGYTVYPVFFQTPYMPSDRAILSAAENDISLIIRDIGPEHLQMMQNPVYGFGKHLNPCVDCHALMFKLAGDMLPELDAKFIISGEVLGQRPMSQRRDALFLVGKLSGYKDLLVRPLSQAHLPDTLPLKEGWVEKSDMLNIHGRSRTKQMELAKELGIVNFPPPAGGCLLTDRNFTLRLKDLMDFQQMDTENLELLRFGRHFRLDDTTKLIVGRDEADNNNISAQVISSVKLLAKNHFGPLGVLTNPHPETDILQKALDIFFSYYPKAPDSGVVNLEFADGTLVSHLAQKTTQAIVSEYRLSYDK